MIAILRHAWESVDRYLLLNHPNMWTFRVHHLAAGTVAGFVLMAGAAFAHPLSLHDVPDVREHVGLVLGAAGVAATCWLAIAIRARHRLPLMVRWQGWTLPLFLAGGVALTLSPGFAYFAVLDARIARLADPRTVSNDIALMEPVIGERAQLLRARPVRFNTGDSASTVAQVRIDEGLDGTSDAVVRAFTRYNGLDSAETRRVGIALAAWDRVFAAILVSWPQGTANDAGSTDTVVVAQPGLLPTLPFGWKSVQTSLEWIDSCFQTGTGSGVLITCSLSRTPGDLSYTNERYELAQLEQRRDVVASSVIQGATRRGVLDTSQTSTRELLRMRRSFATSREHLPSAVFVAFSRANVNARRIADHQGKMHIGITGIEIMLLVIAVLAVTFLGHVFSLGWRFPSSRQLAWLIPALLIASMPFFSAEIVGQALDGSEAIAFEVAAFGLLILVALILRRKAASVSMVLLLSLTVASPLVLWLLIILVFERPSTLENLVHRRDVAGFVALTLAYALTLPGIQRSLNSLRAMRHT